MLLTLGLLLITSTSNIYKVDLIDCYDGDTCRFNVHMGMDVVLVKQGFRLCDIDTPEMRPIVSRDAAKRSRDYLLYRIKKAKELTVDLRGRGKYGRWLAFVYADGVNLNSELVRMKMAEPYRIKCK